MAELRLPNQNKVLIIGRLTRNPESRFTPKGQQVCVFDLALNRRYRDSAGNWQDDTTFVPVETWGQAAERCSQQLVKGTPVSVEGRLRTDSWQGKDGQKRSRLVVVAQRVQSLARAEGGEGGEEGGEGGEEGVEVAKVEKEEVPF